MRRDAFAAAIPASGQEAARSDVVAEAAFDPGSNEQGSLFKENRK